MTGHRATWHRVYRWAVLLGYRVECPTCGTVARTVYKAEAQRLTAEHRINHRKEPS